MARHMKNMAQYSTGRHISNRRSELPSNPKQHKLADGDFGDEEESKIGTWLQDNEEEIPEFEPLDEPESLFVGHEPSPIKKEIPLKHGTETVEIGCGPDLNFIEQQKEVPPV